MKAFTTLAISTISILITLLISCKKSDTYQPATTFLLDSVISSKNSNIHFIYDGQQRVIEEHFYNNDTFSLRNVYEYLGNNVLPVRKTSYSGLNSTPSYISSFQYNNNGQKIYDSTYYPPGSGNLINIVATLDYSTLGKIYVLQKYYPGFPGPGWIWRADTIYFNNNTRNIDSIRIFESQYLTGWYYLNTNVFTQYDIQPNYFNSLNISSGDFYSLTYNQFGEYMYLPGSINLDLFNSNYSTRVSTNYLNASNYSVSLAQFIFNNYNLPVSERYIVTYPSGNYSDTTNFRFVYN